MNNYYEIRLLSVYLTNRLSELVNHLFKNDYNIISTGGTYKYILENMENESNKKNLITVEDFTGFGEILGGRVKTLHPKIYGGILYDPNVEQHRKDFEEYNGSNNPFYNLTKIDLVAVNLYPFFKVYSILNKTDEEIIENIDISVSLLRAMEKIIKMFLVYVM